MKRLSTLVFAAATAACIIASMPLTTRRADDEGSPIFGVKIPAGYRQLELVAPSQEAGNLDELRGILGNAIDEGLSGGDASLPRWRGSLLFAKLTTTHNSQFAISDQ